MQTPTFIENYQTEEYDLCDRIVSRLDEMLETQLNGIPDQNYMAGSADSGHKVRQDHSVDFYAVQDPLTKEVHDKVLSKYTPQYGEKYPGFLNGSSFSQDMKVQKTEPKGGFHIWHKEHDGSYPCSYRSLVWTLYLNDVPDGEGETEFLEYGIKVTPKKGLLCLFPAAWTHLHRGNPVYSCTKYIATGWYYYS